VLPFLGESGEFKGAPPGDPRKKQAPDYSAVESIRHGLDCIRWMQKGQASQGDAAEKRDKGECQEEAGDDVVGADCFHNG